MDGRDAGGQEFRGVRVVTGEAEARVDEAGCDEVAGQVDVLAVRYGGRLVLPHPGDGGAHEGDGRGERIGARVDVSAGQDHRGVSHVAIFSRTRPRRAQPVGWRS